MALFLGLSFEESQQTLLMHEADTFPTAPRVLALSRANLKFKFSAMARRAAVSVPFLLRRARRAG